LTACAACGSFQEGDRVVVEWTARATHSGDFRGIPATHKQVSYAGISIYRIEDVKIADEVYLGDRLGLWQQLGRVPDSRKLVAEVGKDYAADCEHKRAGGVCNVLRPLCFWLHQG
jgi:hypothetical protein